MTRNVLIFVVSCWWTLKVASGSAGIGMLTASEESDFYNCSLSTTSNASVLLFASKGLPDHPTQKVNPNNITAQNFSYLIPTTQPLNGTLSICVNVGVIGFMVNGVPIYNALNAPMDGSLDAVKNEVFDNCSGHSDPTGAYHYHQLSDCIADGTSDEFLGIALDGYPIYGPNASYIVGRLVNSSDLDACHGRFVNGKYRYYVTKDYPYTIGCFRGIPGSSNNTQSMPPGDGPPGMSGPSGPMPSTSVSCSTSAPGKLCDCIVGIVSALDVAQATTTITYLLDQDPPTGFFSITTPKLAATRLCCSFSLLVVLFFVSVQVRFSYF